MPKDPNTGERLRDEEGNIIPYEGETMEEAEADALSTEMDFPARVESLMLEKSGEEMPVEASEEELPAEEVSEELTEEQVQEAAQALYAQMYGADAPVDPNVVAMIAAEIAADPSILADGNIVAALELLLKLRSDGTPPNEDQMIPT